ncbi:MAG: gluconate kinase [Acidobacteria bacterium]|nr:MAG: gluconate kinase [Acidobacteriota bacterium]
MIVIVMGVVGAGKTTVGQLLAQELGWQFADADDFHPLANIEKIRRGIPLTDDDRSPWLDRLREFLLDCVTRQCNLVLACSALKRSYRQELQVGPELQFVYLKGNGDLIAERLRSRHDHFADVQILASQLADLEEPEDAIPVDIARPPEEIVKEIRKQLRVA